MSDVLFEIHGHAAVVTLNRPDKLNAITTEMKRHILESLQAAEEERSISVLIMRGSGRAFCAGADTVELAAEAARGRTYWEAVARVSETQRLVERLRRSRLVVITQLHGLAAGGGVSLALAADIVLSGKSGSIRLLFGQQGLVPDGELVRTLSESVGIRRARSLVLRCAALTADEARALGIVDAVVEDEALADEVDSLAMDIAARGPDVNGRTKLIFASPLGHDLTLEALGQADRLSRSGAYSEDSSSLEPTDRSQR